MDKSIKVWMRREDGEQYEAELPAKYEVCPGCAGEGKSSAYLGSFTISEMEELGEEFIDDYTAGHFDRPCEVCKGRRVVLSVDYERIELIEEQDYERELAFEAECRMEQAAERRAMGVY